MLVYIGQLPPWLAFAFMDVWRFILAGIYDMMPMLSYMFLASIVLTSIPQTRRSSGAIWRYTLDNAPRWLMPTMTVCAFIPGPVDEIIVLVVVMVWLLGNARRRAELSAQVAIAWRGPRYA